MQITDILAQMGGLESIARELGVSEAQAASGAAALAPAILAGFKNRLCFLLFGTRWGARVFYPIRKAFRNLVLKLLGISYIGNLKSPAT